MNCVSYNMLWDWPIKRSSHISVVVFLPQPLYLPPPPPPHPFPPPPVKAIFIQFKCKRVTWLLLPAPMHWTKNVKLGQNTHRITNESLTYFFSSFLQILDKYQLSVYLTDICWGFEEKKKSCTTHKGRNRWSSEIQGTALGKSLRAWPCIYRSMPAGVAQSSHAFVGGTVSTWGRWRIPINKRHQKCRSNTHCSGGTCRSDSRFPQLVV